jgi:hypothetical protein
MKYVGVKFGAGVSISGNPNNRSFVHIAAGIVPTAQKATITFWDYYHWSAYSERYEAMKTYFYCELGITFLINLNKSKTFHALADISLAMVPDNNTPFTKFKSLKTYDIVVPGAGSYEFINPSLGFGFAYSF